MKITFESNDYYPFYSYREPFEYEKVCTDIQQETIDRWDRIRKEFDNMQDEMEQLSKAECDMYSKLNNK